MLQQAKLQAKRQNRLSANTQRVSHPRTKRVLGWVAGTLSVLLVVGLAVISDGVTASETPREEASVWVARADGQYARVNTQTNEIDTVRSVESSVSITQSGQHGVLLGLVGGKAWAIDASAPQDITAEDTQAPGAFEIPAGAKSMGAHGSSLLLLSESGEALIVNASTGATTWVLATDAVAAAIDSRGMVAVVSRGDTAGALNGERTAASSELAEESSAANSNAATGAGQTLQVRWFDSVNGEPVGDAAALPEMGSQQLTVDTLQLAIVRGDWVLFDSGSGYLWREGVPASTPLEPVGAALLQESAWFPNGESAGGATGGEDDGTDGTSGGTGVASGGAVGSNDVLVADEAGLWAVAPNGAATRIFEAAGSPAKPVVLERGTPVRTDVAAAWLPGEGGTLWSLSAGEQALSADPAVQAGGEVAPVLFSNGSRAVLAEQRTGMMWAVPTGELIAVEQWSLVDPPTRAAGEAIAQDPAQQEPPVAVDDAFGVRAGEPVLLQMLLNDYDPNRKDVLTVLDGATSDGLDTEPSAGQIAGFGLDPAFGTLGVLADGQGLVLTPSANATGSTQFTYRVSDGVAASAPATVTLTVAPEDINTAPQWCPVVGCQLAWPTPEITPGGTLVLPLLNGWVDPEGDPIVLEQASVKSGEHTRVLVTAEGELAIRHTEQAVADSEVVISVTVADARGAQTEKDLSVVVRSGASIQLPAAAVTAQVGAALHVQPLQQVTGGSGSFQLLDASVQQGNVALAVNQAAGTLTLEASDPGLSVVELTVQDAISGNQVSSSLRIDAVEQRAPLAVRPLQAFVRPNSDTTLDVLSAISGASNRALAVQTATVRQQVAVAEPTQLWADVVEHTRVRVSGSTASGQPGLVGGVDVVVTETRTETTGVASNSPGVANNPGESDAADRTRQATARLTVFQASAAARQAIAVGDAASVRAGAVVDIDVLANDVAPPGERLVLSPNVQGSATAGELSFASGNLLRYLAPETPGTYVLQYETYASSNPTISDTASVYVTVLPKQGNRDPQPAALTVRVAPGEQATVQVPVSGIDPDGDRVRAIEATAPADAKLAVTLQPRTSSIVVAAAATTERGVYTGSYLVRDGAGGEARGELRIIVTDPGAGPGAPVVYSDYSRISREAGVAAVVRPLDNDIDPSGGTLELVEVVPNVQGTASDAAQQTGASSSASAAAEALARLDLSDMSSGVVRVAATELGTVSYRYTVRSTLTGSTADGLIVVQVAEQVGAQAPTVTDTVLSVRDRSELSRSGVDVVTDRVRWSAGDVSTLRLGLWAESAERYRVEGNRILGTYRPAGDTITFSLTGVDASGNEVVTYGFLLVPPLEELRLTLKPGIDPLQVAEGGTVEANIASLLELGPGDEVELAQDRFAVQRGQASCAATGLTSMQYIAGRDGPWNDICTIRVRLVEQQMYTLLPVPIRIEPSNPVATLQPLTRTIAPGATERVDLSEMLSWQGTETGTPGAVKFTVSGDPTAFTLGTLAGTVLPVQANAAATSGAQNTIQVSISGSGQRAASTLTLRVGTVAIDAPQGAQLALNCTVGASCSTNVVGVPGEYDPFAGAPGGGLTPVSLDMATCAAYGSLQLQGNRAVMQWADARGVGGECQASFVVRDAQNRVGTGTLSLQIAGYPPAPASLSQTGFTDSSITLSVNLGEALTARPAASAVRIYRAGSVVPANCGPLAAVVTCEITGLQLGERANYTAAVVNAVGESRQTAVVAAWPFRLPEAPQVTRVEQLSAESATAGTVRFTVQSTDATTESIEIRVDGVTRGTLAATAGEIDVAQVAVGAAVQYEVVAVSRFARPGGGSQASTGTLGTVAVAGVPQLGEPEFTLSPDGTQLVVRIVAQTQGGGQLNYGAMIGESCVVAGAADTVTLPLDAPSDPAGSTIRVTVCASNQWGQAAPLTRDFFREGQTP